jgi:hypothetical protein
MHLIFYYSLLGFSIMSRFKTFGGRDPHRPAEDVAFSVARFFQKGGSVHNYYMVQFHFFLIMILYGIIHFIVLGTTI